MQLLDGGAQQARVVEEPALLGQQFRYRLYTRIGVSGSAVMAVHNSESIQHLPVLVLGPLGARGRVERSTQVQGLRVRVSSPAPGLRPQCIPAHAHKQANGQQGGGAVGNGCGNAFADEMHGQRQRSPLVWFLACFL